MKTITITYNELGPDYCRHADGTGGPCDAAEVIPRLVASGWERKLREKRDGRVVEAWVKER